MTRTGRSVKKPRASSTDIARTSTMFIAPQPVAEDLVGVAAALAHLAHAGDVGHEREVGVDQAQAVAGRARSLRVRAEQRLLHPVGGRERAPDRVQDARVRRRVRAP